MAGAVVTPNRDEARRHCPEVTGDDLAGHCGRAGRLWSRWQAGAVVVTLGADGALAWAGTGPPLVVPAPEVPAADTCGAGDAFAGQLALSLGAGRPLSAAVEAAVHAAAWFVAAGAAGSVRPRAGAAGSLGPRAAAGPAHRPAPSTAEPPGSVSPGPRSGSPSSPTPGSAPVRPPAPAGAVGSVIDEAVALAEAVRRNGGTVVATGGCFDLLHAGHVNLLRTARRLGDVLIVCLNSDASVTRLKGPGRPLQSAADRRTVLLALDAVDGVVVFDDDTPAAALARLRPQVFVKGGDYAGIEIPEAALCATWGGQAVTVPYVSHHSTSALVELARRSA